MTTIPVPKIATSELRADAFQEGGAFGARFEGNADTRAMTAIDALLTGLHAEALRLKAPKVMIDLRGLEFMNSSCFKAFLMWIGKVAALEPAEQYAIVFRSDPKKHWQNRSLEALRCFAVDLIRVET
jgi:hypothetical protein